MKKIKLLIRKINGLPVLMAKLFVVQFFTWFGLFALWIYATPVITKYVFNATDSSTQEFENGISWVGYCFAFYTLFAAFFAFYLPRIYKKLGKSRLHAIMLLTGSIGIMLLFFINNKWMLIIPFLLIGVAWSSISNIPYRIVGALAGESADFYFGIFSFSVVIPQIFAAALLGLITKYFNGETNDTILCGGLSMLAGSMVMFFVKEDLPKTV